MATECYDKGNFNSAMAIIGEDDLRIEWGGGGVQVFVIFLTSRAEFTDVPKLDFGRVTHTKRGKESRVVFARFFNQS